MLTSTKQQRNQNGQATKAILTQLYVSWASEPENIKLLKDTINETIAAFNAAKEAVGASGDAGAKDKHADPNKDVGATSGAGRRSESPPVTPPSGQAKWKTGANDHRTPSPQQGGVRPSTYGWGDSSDDAARAASLGWDLTEEEAARRSGTQTGQAGGSSPLSLRTQRSPGFGGSGGSMSPPGTHGSGESTDAVVSTSLGDVMPTNVDLNATVNKDSSVGRFVHSTGEFASCAPANVQQATLDDIPVFYTAKDSNGVLDGLPKEETERLVALFEANGDGPAGKKTVHKKVFADICVQVFKIPIWMSSMLFEDIAEKICNDTAREVLSQAEVTKYYEEKLGRLTPSRRLFVLIRRETDSPREYLVVEDLKAMVACLVRAHPTLSFLVQLDFQEYYCRTVAIRIMYSLEHQQNRRLSWRDFDRSDLPEVLAELDGKDVNEVLRYFSYEHFYVLYCRFWELDTDRDMMVGFADLCNYGTIPHNVIQRVLQGYGRELSSDRPGCLNYEDFLYFCLSEEDKNTEPAVYYWFKVLDLDGDGILSGYEMMIFYEENQQRFLEQGEGAIAYEDTLCQMLDMLGFDRIKTRKYGVTLGDLRACPTPANFFNMIFNAAKFMAFEHRDPFFEHHLKLRPEKTDWDRFARVEYDRMAADSE